MCEKKNKYALEECKMTKNDKSEIFNFILKSILLSKVNIVYCADLINLKQGM